MAAPWLIMGLVLVIMTIGLAVDLSLGGGGTGAPEADPTVAAPQVRLPAPWYDPLAERAEGWALLAPSGRIVATNLPERAALLTALLAVLRLGSEQGGWHTALLQGPEAALLARLSARGALLAVLARGEVDAAALGAAMSTALERVEERWDDLVGPAPTTPGVPEGAAPPA